MARAKAFGPSSGMALRLTLGLFFVALGMTGILPQAGEGFFGLSKDRTAMEVVFGVIELACGAFFLFDALASVPRKTSLTATLVVLVLWTARLVYTLFIQGVVLRDSGISFRPDFWNWSLALTTDLVLLAVVWTLYRSE